MHPAGRSKVDPSAVTRRLGYDTDVGTGRTSLVGTRLLAVLGAVVALAVGVVAINAASAADVTDPSVCVVEVSGSTATLSWFDTGGIHVIRRNNRWLATPGSNVSTFVDPASPTSATYVVRTWIGNSSTDRNCAPPPSTTTTSTSTTTSIDSRPPRHRPRRPPRARPPRPASRPPRPPPRPPPRRRRPPRPRRPPRRRRRPPPRPRRRRPRPPPRRPCRRPRRRPAAASSATVRR